MAFTVYFPRVCDTNIQDGYNLPDVNLNIAGVSTTSNASSVSLNSTGGTFTVTANKAHYNNYSKTGCKIVAEYECDVCGGPVTGSTGTLCPVCGEPLTTDGKSFKYQVAIDNKTDNMGGKIVMTRADNVCMTEQDFVDAVISGTSATQDLIRPNQYVANQLLVNKTYITKPFDYVKNYVNDKIDSGITRSGSPNPPQAFVFKKNFIPKEIAPEEIKYIRIVSGKTQNAGSDFENTISGLVITNTTNLVATSGGTNGMFLSPISLSLKNGVWTFTTTVGLSATARVGTITFTGTGARPQTATIIQGETQESFSMNAPATVAATATGITVSASTSPSATIWLKQGNTQIGNPWSFAGDNQTHTFSINANTGYTAVTYTLSGVTALGTTGGTRSVTQEAKTQTVSLNNTQAQINASDTTVPYTVTFAAPYVDVQLKIGNTVKGTQRITTSPTTTAFSIDANETLTAITYTIVATTQGGATATAQTIQNGVGESLSISANNVTANATSLPFTATTNTNSVVLGLYTGGSSTPIATKTIGNGTTQNSFTITANTKPTAITYIISGSTNGGVTASKQVTQAAAAAYITVASGKSQSVTGDYIGDITGYVVTNLSSIGIYADCSGSTVGDMFSGSPMLGPGMDIGGGATRYKFTANIFGWSDVNDPRYGILIFSGSGIEDRAIITQSAVVPFINITPYASTFTSGGGASTYTVTSNIPWTASTNNSSMISLTTTGGTEGQTTAQFSVLPNTTNVNARTGNITVANTGAGVSTGFTVSQSGTAVYVILKQATTAPFDATGGTGTYTVSANTPWTASTTANTMITLTGGTTGSTGQTQKGFTVANYTGTTQRSGDITITGNGASTAFTVTQSAAETGYSEYDLYISVTSKGSVDAGSFNSIIVTFDGDGHTVQSDVKDSIGGMDIHIGNLQRNYILDGMQLLVGFTGTFPPWNLPDVEGTANIDGEEEQTDSFQYDDSGGGDNTLVFYFNNPINYADQDKIYINLEIDAN